VTAPDLSALRDAVIEKLTAARGNGLELPAYLAVAHDALIAAEQPYRVEDLGPVGFSFQIYGPSNFHCMCVCPTKSDAHQVCAALNEQAARKP